MSVVTGALGSLATKLLKLLHAEYKLQKGVKKQVQWLTRELDSIYAFLCKVSDVPWDRLDEQVKVWAREVREASYDMEDVLDAFLVRVDGGEPTDPSMLKSSIRKIGKVFSKAKARCEISCAIQETREYLEEVAERRQKYKLDEIMCRPVPTSTIDPRLTAMFKEVKQLIGVDKSKDELISMLNPSQLGLGAGAPDKTIKKVSIVGVGGLGKTTLAKVVYDNLYSQFDCAAFVSIGRDLDLVKVFEDMLFNLDKKLYENIHHSKRGAELLIHELREFLQNKRYIIVVDDVWEVQTWKRIELALVENNCGSKVITTTRKYDVAQEAGEVYKIKPLSYDDSMKLFYTRIFGVGGKYHDDQPNDGLNKILRRCAGIPLAIITMSSLLVRKPMCEWCEVYNSIGFVCKDNSEAEDTMTILSFSYFDLPPHLRTCLLYLSSYPEDYLIEKDSLIWKWVAEGFIDEKQGTRLFELGERYFNDLINRSLIHTVEDFWGAKVVTSYRVHDMVLDLMRKISYEENFISILGDVEGASKPCSVRRLVNQNRIAEHINIEVLVMGMPKVRSYAAFMCRIGNRHQFLSFKLLCVLDIVQCHFKKGWRLDHLGDLHHLRYLGVRRCGRSVPVLPEQIGNLKLLQTLDVDGNLPGSIVKLTKLVRLCAEKSYAPDGIGNMTSLEELKICGSETDRFTKQLGSLRELRVLEFSIRLGMNKQVQRDFVESLCNLKNIQRIYVDGQFSDADATIWEAAGFLLPRSLLSLDLLIYFSKLPSCINTSCLPNLSYLALRVNTMDEQDIKLLARLPALCSLELWIMSTLTASNINADDDCCFQKLRYFEIYILVQYEQPNQEDPHLHRWNEEKQNSRKVVPSGVMPNLEVFQFDVPLLALKDNNTDFWNMGLEYLPSLRKLTGRFNCDGMSAEEVHAALCALKMACTIHPNNPTLDIATY